MELREFPLVPCWSVPQISPFHAVSAVQSGYFHNKVRSILVLPGALGADHLVRMKDIHSLAAEYRVFMGNQWQVVPPVPYLADMVGATGCGPV